MTLNIEPLIADGVYVDDNKIMWVFENTDNGCEKSRWIRSDTGVSYSPSQFRDKVIMEQMKRNTQADALDRAGASGAFGTRAQSTLFTMAKMLRAGTLQEFLDENGCQW